MKGKGKYNECTPALRELYLKDMLTKDSNSTKSKKALINYNFSRQKNTFNSVFPSTLIFNT